jgi:hypothetical protein
MKKKRYKRWFRLVWYLNGLILLGIFATLAVAGIVLWVASLLPEPAGADRAASQTPGKPVPGRLSLGEPRMTGDYLAFEVRPESGELGRLESGPYREYESADPVNLVFVSVKTGTKQLLFEKNVLIPRIHYATFVKSRPDQPVFPKNLYLVASRDSNGNGRLDPGDRLDLYLSSYTGRWLTLLVKDAVEFQILADNHVLITALESGGKVFMDYDPRIAVLKRVLTQADWRELAADEK